MERASGLNTENQSSEQYDPAQAESAVSAILSPSTSNVQAFTEPSVDTYQVNTSVPDHASQSAPKTSSLVDASPDHQSKSRSMSAESSSASDQEIITHQDPQPMSSNGVSGTSAPLTNGVSAFASQSDPKVPVSVDLPKNASLETAVQGSDASQVPASPFPDGNIDMPVDTPPPPQNDLNIPATNAEASKVQPPSTPSIALPKARLPHDRIGMLEDRIKDDPRGDIEAWLGLIDEHKKRNKLEDARACYERFFAVFPSAVCPCPPPVIAMLIRDQGRGLAILCSDGKRRQ